MSKRGTTEEPHVDATAKNTATFVFDNAPSMLASLDSLLETHFPFQPGEISQVEQAFDRQLRETGYLKANSALDAAIPPYRDNLSRMQFDLITLEGWLLRSLTLKERMNKSPIYFLQIDILENIREQRKMLSGDIDSIYKYFSDRSSAGGNLGYLKAEVSKETWILSSETPVPSPCEGVMTFGGGGEQDGRPSVLAIAPLLRFKEEKEKSKEGDSSDGAYETHPLTLQREKEWGPPGAGTLSSYNAQMKYLTIDVAFYQKMSASIHHHIRVYEANSQNVRELHNRLAMPASGLRYFAYGFIKCMGC
jgi:hypothetical protein